MEALRGGPGLSAPRRAAVGLAGALAAAGCGSSNHAITNVFVGDDEYELNCQYTPKGAGTITAACNQMLSTLSTRR